MKELRFLWWNVCDFSHFDAERRARARRPKTEPAYSEKLARIEGAFGAMYGADTPDLIGLTEITMTAALDLKRRLRPDYDVRFSNPELPDAFQLAVLIRSRSGLVHGDPLFGEDVPPKSRRMCTANFTAVQHRIRFVFCHWTGFDDRSSRENRSRLADALRKGIYEYLEPERPSSMRRHIVALGDFNEEPFDALFESKLNAARDRGHAMQKKHPADRPVRRVRLYNCGWRHLGEREAHRGQPLSPSQAGTYYSASEKVWRTYDQVLVSGGLFSGEAPYFDESQLLVRSDACSLLEDRTPAKFDFDGGSAKGLSDHYPVTGRIALA